MRGRKVFIAQLFLKYILWAKLTLQCGYNSCHHGVYNLMNETDECNELNSIYPKINVHQDWSYLKEYLYRYTYSPASRDEIILNLIYSHKKKRRIWDMENTRWRWRQKIELCYHKSRNTRNQHKLKETRTNSLLEILKGVWPYQNLDFSILSPGTVTE